MFCVAAVLLATIAQPFKLLRWQDEDPIDSDESRAYLEVQRQDMNQSRTAAIQGISVRGAGACRKPRPHPKGQRSYRRGYFGCSDWRND